MKLTGRDLESLLKDEDDEISDVAMVSNQIEKMRTAAIKNRKAEDREYHQPDAKRFHKKAHN